MYVCMYVCMYACVCTYVFCAQTHLLTTLCLVYKILCRTHLLYLKTEGFHFADLANITESQPEFIKI